MLTGSLSNLAGDMVRLSMIREHLVMLVSLIIIRGGAIGRMPHSPNIWFVGRFALDAELVDKSYWLI